MDNHLDDVAPLRPRLKLNFIYKVFNQKDPPAPRSILPFNLLFNVGCPNLLDHVTFLVMYLHPQSGSFYCKTDPHFDTGIKLVAMLDRIDTGFRDGSF